MSETLLRFESNAGAIRISLNDPTNGFFLAPGIDLGFAGVEYEWLQQPPYEALLGGWAPVNRHLQIPLGFKNSVSASARATLVTTLLTELKRDTNKLRYQPPDWPMQWVFDTYVSPEPDAISAWLHEFSTETVGWLQIPARPYFTVVTP